MPAAKCRAGAADAAEGAWASGDPAIQLLAETAMALRLAVTADPDFALAAADLEAITGTPGSASEAKPL